MNDQLNNLIIIKQSPYVGRSAHEILEAIMALGLFDVPHRVVFFEAGLLWLADSQTPLSGKSLAKQISALAIYGSESLFYCATHAKTMGIPPEAIRCDIESISNEILVQWAREANRVEVF